ncbi:MAG: hypothetical protein E7515_01780 [Ruminococcaceae bacterium]|jgi:hypothetical protein|nr:hypothetical protein [Oscillospiraceae bacterium]
MKRIKSKNVGVLICLAACLLIVIVAGLLRDVFNAAERDINLYISICEAIGVLITIALAIAQLSDSKEISRASFIVELNKSFVENEDYKRVYDILQASVDHNCDENNYYENDNCEVSLSKSDISNYLTFFETLYILYRRGVISFDIIDDLFAYRFFLVVHSRAIQKQKLLPQPENFRNIFLLEKEWLSYRVKIGKNSPERLKECCDDYRKVITGEKEKPEISWNNVYEARLLKSLVSESRYAVLTGDKNEA